jgi:hypothetical protein
MTFISTACHRDLLAAGFQCEEPRTERPFSGVSSPAAHYARQFLGLPLDRTGRGWRDEDALLCASCRRTPV